MLMRGVKSLGVYVVVATAVVYLTYRQLAQPWWWQWFMFYLASVIWPAIWTYRSLQMLQGEAPDAKRRVFAWAPVIVGVTTMAAALSLIERAAGRVP